MTREFFDISRTLHEGMGVWPGDPEFRQQPILRIGRGDPSNVLEIRLGTHTGTHIDAPRHIDDSGADAAGIPIRHCIGPARLVSIPVGECIRAADLDGMDWRGVERVLFRTGDRSRPERPFDPAFACLAEDAAEFLAGKGLLLVGTDAPSVDPFESTELRSHRILLGSGIVILEGARLGGIPPGDYSLICLPLKIEGADGSPVRAILWKT